MSAAEPIAELIAEPIEPSRFSLRQAGWWVGGLALLLLAGAAARVWSNTRSTDALAQDSAADVVQQVLTVRAKPAGGPRSVSLPGTLRGNQEAVVYARTGGYLKRLTKDIGDTVQRGELLAVLDAPEADQELSQARAAREQVRARAALAKSSLVRFESLGERDAVSRQEIDERRAAQAQGVADVAAADANVKRLEALESLRRVVAPFNGVVVRRSADVGSLISASNGRELYFIAEVETLRIELAVPQAYAADVHAGQTVHVRWPERAGRAVEGKISRVAPGIDTATRTRQAVIELPNADRQLLPGSYVDVQLAAGKAGGAKPAGKATPGVLSVLPGVLQFRQDGPRVALVEQGRIVLRNVKLGRDLGREVEVVSGLGLNDEIVLNPSDSITEGARVRAQAVPEDKPKAAEPARPASGAAPGAA